MSLDLEEGRLRRLAPRVYTTNLTEAPDSLVRRQVWQLASLLLPDAVITDRTAFEAGPSSDGSLFLAGPYARDVALPGITLRVREGVGPLGGDTPFLGLHMASRARAYLENIPASRARKGVARRLSRPELEERLEADVSTRGEAYVNALRDEARKLAPMLGLETELGALDALIGALLGTREARLETQVGNARAAGPPYDAKRLELLARLHADLLKESPSHRLEPLRPGEERFLPLLRGLFLELHRRHRVRGRRGRSDRVRRSDPSRSARGCARRSRNVPRRGRSRRDGTNPDDLRSSSRASEAGTRV